MRPCDGRILCTKRASAALGKNLENTFIRDGPGSKQALTPVRIVLYLVFANFTMKDPSKVFDS